MDSLPSFQDSDLILQITTKLYDAFKRELISQDNRLVQNLPISQQTQNLQEKFAHLPVKSEAPSIPDSVIETDKSAIGTSLRRISEPFNTGNFRGSFDTQILPFLQSRSQLGVQSPFQGGRFPAPLQTDFQNSDTQFSDTMLTRNSFDAEAVPITISEPIIQGELSANDSTDQRRKSAPFNAVNRSLTDT